MERAKVICMCGSLKFKDEFIKQSEKLELEGYCVLSVIYPTSDNNDYYTEEQVKLLDKLHKQRIDMADAIFVVNVNGILVTVQEMKLIMQNKLEKK
jgi:hypothetical protein